MVLRAWRTNDFTKWILWETRLKAELGRHPKVEGCGGEIYGRKDEA